MVVTLGSSTALIMPPCLKHACTCVLHTLPTHPHRQPLRAGQLEPGERGRRWECQAVWHGSPGREAVRTVARGAAMQSGACSRCASSSFARACACASSCRRLSTSPCSATSLPQGAACTTTQPGERHQVTRTYAGTLHTASRVRAHRTGRCDGRQVLRLQLLGARLRLSQLLPQALHLASQRHLAAVGLRWCGAAVIGLACGGIRAFSSPYPPECGAWVAQQEPWVAAESWREPVPAPNQKQQCRADAQQQRTAPCCVLHCGGGKCDKHRVHMTTL